MSESIRVKRDTGAWVFQVWASFAIAVFLAIYSIWNLPGEAEGRMLLAMGFFFCLSSSFVLAKAIRDNQYKAVDTPMWRGQVWAAFIIATCLTGWALSRMPLAHDYVWFVVTSWLFLVSSTFTLTKTMRDKYDADVAEGMIGGRYEDDTERAGRVNLEKK